ncbi:MAG: hypothetical protein AMK73_03440 [Planctomycetes bacterium SM23_32]|nr:MAG: hypothetical protein AMK73_03440 [Planctomycetes bacterium SM23_32]
MPMRILLADHHHVAGKAPDAVLMDVAMLAPDGIQAMRQVAPQGRRLSMLTLSEHMGRHNVRAVLSAGAGTAPRARP